MPLPQSVLSRIVVIILLGTVAGVAASLLAILFIELVFTLNDFLFISPRSRVMADSPGLLMVATITVPAAGGLIVGLICRGMPDRRPVGPPDVIQAAQDGRGDISLKSGATSALASAVSLGSGASVGQYGPLVHMGATLGSLFGRLFDASRAMRRIGIGCGVAAAISAAFNAPIAGIVFAHEVILRHYSLRAFAPITVASTIGYIVANVIFERSPLFRIQRLGVAHALEFVIFILIGICGAFVAWFYMKAILYTSDLAARLDVPQYLKPAMAGAALGVTAIWIPDILGIGKETLRFAIIDGAFSPGELAMTLGAKILATALCIGFGFAGGVFSPALLIGTLFGALAGAGATLVAGIGHSDIAIYAICGMVAVTSPVIGAPLTSILIVFELTRNYDLTTAVMVSVVFANLVSYRIFGRSLFDMQLASRGFDLSMGRDKVILERRSIEDYVTTEYTALDPHTSLAEARSTLIEAARSEAYVTTTEGTYVGKVTLVQLVALDSRGVSPQETVQQFARHESIILTETTSIWAAMKQMEGFVGESIPVVKGPDDDQLLGVVFEAVIVRAYLDTMHEIRNEENAAP